MKTTEKREYDKTYLETMAGHGVSRSRLVVMNLILRENARFF